MRRREFLKAALAAVATGPSLLKVAPAAANVPHLLPSAARTWAPDMFDYFFQRVSLTELMGGTGALMITKEGIKETKLCQSKLI